MNAIGAVPPPNKEYSSRVIPVAPFRAGSMDDLAFFFGTGAVGVEMERTSRISWLVILC